MSGGSRASIRTAVRRLEIWLARGLDKAVADFIGRAVDANWALDVVMYQYEIESLRGALLAAAKDRAVNARLVYHAGTKATDDQTPKNEANVQEWPAPVRRALVTPAICHDKTIVLSRLQNGARQPVAVLTGSTNWTFNALYFQANVAHAVDDPALAERYLAIFEALFGGASQQQTRAWIGANNPIPVSPGAPASELSPAFSPRPLRDDLEYYVDLISSAQRSLIFATAFDLDKTILDALAGLNPNAPRILRYGLQDKASEITGYHRDHTSFFTAATRLTSAPEGFLRESIHGQTGNILVHAKIIVLDFDTAHPIVISGSANFSNNSSVNNDENVIVVRDDMTAADIYVCEMLRLFDHYRFRYNTSDEPAGGTVQPRNQLDPTDAWTNTYYDLSDPHAIERQQLSRPLS